MILLSISIIFIGSSLLYSTSKKAVYNKSRLNKWLAHYSNAVKVAAALCYMISLWLLSIEYGIGLSVFYFLLSLMTIKSLIIMLIPFLKPSTSRPETAASSPIKKNEPCLQIQNT